jgi:hypothetical protein
MDPIEEDGFRLLLIYDLAQVEVETAVPIHRLDVLGLEALRDGLAQWKALSVSELVDGTTPTPAAVDAYVYVPPRKVLGEVPDLEVITARHGGGGALLTAAARGRRPHSAVPHNVHLWQRQR